MSDDEELDELRGLGGDEVDEVDEVADMFGNLQFFQREGAINPLAKQESKIIKEENKARRSLDIAQGFPSNDPNYKKVVNQDIARIQYEERLQGRPDAKRFKRPGRPERSMDNRNMEDIFGVGPKDKNNDGGGGIMT